MGLRNIWFDLGPGEFEKAFISAYRDFEQLKTLNAPQRDLSRYVVSIGQLPRGEYTVEFVPKEIFGHGGIIDCYASERAVMVSYAITKSYKIARRWVCY